MKRGGIIVKWLIGILGIVGLSLGFVGPVQGESLQSFDAQIQPNQEIPSQNDAYFDLQLVPEQEVQLKVIVTNLKESPVTIIPSFNRARTNQLGVVEYSGKNQDTTQALPADIEKVVQLSQKEFTLKENEQKILELTVTMPNKPFEGVLAGGIYLQEKPREKAQGNIQNVFSREIAVLLQNEREKIEPVLEMKEASPTQVNGRNAVKVGLQNTKATYLSTADIQYELFNGNEETPQLSGNQAIGFAPNSGMAYLIFLEGQKFEEGTYRLKITVSKEDFHWSDEMLFKVSKKTSDSYNRKDASIEEPEKPFPWLLWLGIGTILGLVLVIVWLLNKLRKNNQNE